MKRVALFLTLSLFTTMALAEPLWIDVRSAEEYSEGHLDQAINIPHDEIDEEIEEVTADRTAQINLYCASGRRAGKAKESLEKMGYINVINRGGYDSVKHLDDDK
ncbi:MAG: rhodanese-like domain-containing protein [Pseudomonadota bacterium]